MSLNSGFGAVVEKTVNIMEKQSLDVPTAVRHGNGRDWWVMTPDYVLSRYYTHLITPGTILGPFQQDIGMKPPFDISPDFGGANLFSPEGYKYVDYDERNGIRIYDFDRCTGLLNNRIVC